MKGSKFISDLDDRCVAVVIVAYAYAKLCGLALSDIPNNLINICLKVSGYENREKLMLAIKDIDNVIGSLQ